MTPVRRGVSFKPARPRLETEFPVSPLCFRNVHSNWIKCVIARLWPWRCSMMVGAVENCSNRGISSRERSTSRHVSGCLKCATTSQRRLLCTFCHNDELASTIPKLIMSIGTDQDMHAYLDYPLIYVAITHTTSPHVSNTGSQISIPDRRHSEANDPSHRFLQSSAFSGLGPTGCHRGWYITQARPTSPHWSQYIIDVQ